MGWFGSQDDPRARAAYAELAEHHEVRKPLRLWGR